jgi:hypothetical protein
MVNRKIAVVRLQKFVFHLCNLTSALCPLSPFDIVRFRSYP